MISGKLNQIRNRKNLNPIQVLSIQTDIKRGGRVSMSTGIRKRKNNENSLDQMIIFLVSLLLSPSLTNSFHLKHED